jgi:hypothetical protein
MTGSAPTDGPSADTARETGESIERFGGGGGTGLATDDAATVGVEAGSATASAASEAFQTLASEVRVAVLCELLAAEQADDTPRSFSELQDAAGIDSSAGFAYHLRQLTGRFVREVEGGPDAGDGETRGAASPDGYELTAAGRAAARTVAAGTFTGDVDADQAS